LGACIGKREKTEYPVNYLPLNETGNDFVFVFYIFVDVRAKIRLITLDVYTYLKGDDSNAVFQYPMIKG